MDLSVKALSDITIYSKYSRFMPHKNRRETWEEVCFRNRNMHLDTYPQLQQEIMDVYNNFVIPKKVLPSMRALQFSGKPMLLTPNRGYNCCFLPIDDYKAFSETMFLLLGGSGVGYSVQRHHVSKLPAVRKPVEKKRYVVGDSIEGWAEAVRVLVKAYFGGGWLPLFDFRDVRPKGANLITAGGKAPGPDPLKKCLENIKALLDKTQDGRKINPLLAHDIQCFIADAVLSGGIRRAAMISLFDVDDEDMLKCKHGEWYKENPQRARANNSAMIVRHKVSKQDFYDIWKIVKDSGSGEPGIYFTNNPYWGTNPCGEVALRPNQFCNLCEIDASSIQDLDDYVNRARAASFLGTLQAGYTDFHYLRSIWKETTERDALLGVSATGIATQSFIDLDHTKAAEAVRAENKRVAKLIGVKTSARTTCIKPSGTTSCVLGTSSGIHPWFDEYYLRRIRVGKNESIYNYLAENHAYLLEDDVEKPDLQSIAAFPIKSPGGAITRNEGVFNLLNRIAFFSTKWIKPGHFKGDNSHNVSATIYVKDHEWESVGEWMWENRELYNGLSVLPYDGGTYQQTPFETISAEQYGKLAAEMKTIDLKQVKEVSDETNFNDQVACSGSSCEVL